jgi:two-component system response regulator FixJ
MRRPNLPIEPFIHVIDDDDGVRDSLVFLLDAAGLKARGYDSAARFLDRIESVEPGCIITDVRMPDMTGLELVGRLNALGASMPVIVMTGHGDVPLAVEAMRAGVADFIEKPFSDDIILTALRRALDRGRDQIALVAGRREIGERLASLSMRERQVLNGLVLGQANKVVAIELGISPRTVEVYRANVMAKMHASSLSELVRMVLLAERQA